MSLTAEDADLVFPDDLDLEIPEDQLYRQKFSGKTIVDLQADGYLELARQVGIVSLTSTVIDLFETDDGVLYAAVEASIKLENSDQEWNAYGDADSADTDPEQVLRVAETRAQRRVCKKALGIRVTSSSEGSGDSKGSDRSPPTPPAVEEEEPEPEPEPETESEPEPDPVSAETGDGPDW